MINIDRAAASEKGRRLIPIRNAAFHYEPDFYIEDGKNMTIIYPDGERAIRSCKYLDDYHFMLGTACYHVDQFAELIARNNFRCEPEEYVTDLDLFRKVYLDRELKDLNGKLIPYRVIVSNEDRNGANQIVAVCPGTIIDRMVAVYDRNARGTSFCSVEKALTDILPGLELPEHQKNLLGKVLLCIGKEIPRISEQEFEAIPRDYKGIYSNFNGRHPEWEGKRTAFLPGHGTTLFIEGVSFLIDGSRKPALSKLIQSAENKCEMLSKEPNGRTEPSCER